MRGVCAQDKSLALCDIQLLVQQQKGIPPAQQGLWIVGKPPFQMCISGSTHEAEIKWSTSLSDMKKM